MRICCQFIQQRRGCVMVSSASIWNLFLGISDVSLLAISTIPAAVQKHIDFKTETCRECERRGIAFKKYYRGVEQRTANYIPVASGFHTYQ